MAGKAINRGDSGTNRAVTEMDRLMLRAVYYNVLSEKG